MNAMIEFYNAIINTYATLLSTADTDDKRHLYNSLMQEVADIIRDCVKARDNECTPGK